MNKNCIFTIVAKNYIGLAKILEKTVNKYDDVDFYIFVADEYKKGEDDSNIIVSGDVIDIAPDKLKEMSLKYDITEFCTSIKPFCFLHLLIKYEKAIYLDPDILTFSTFSTVFSLLDKYDIVVTPHIARCHENYKGDLPENQIIGTGIFNFGFAAFNNSDLSHKILRWWGNKLLDYSFSDVYTYLYTDQHWMDLLPCYCGERLYVLRDLGYNIAPWNFFEREIVCDANSFYVKERENENSIQTPVVFVHYSGYNYKRLLGGSIEQKNIHKDLAYPDTLDLLKIYGDFLDKHKEIFIKYIDLPYTYNKFSNGHEITYFQRRLYNAYVKNKSITENSFCQLVKEKKIINSCVNAVDKASVYNLPDIDSKISKLNSLFKLLFKVVGYNKYILIIKTMRYYSRYENHVFLLK